MLSLEHSNLVPVLATPSTLFMKAYPILDTKACPKSLRLISSNKNKMRMVINPALGSPSE
jgi:hypothetical protein